jgi:hypothetical protein
MLINGKVIFLKTILALCYLLVNEIRIRNRIQIRAKNLRIRIQEAKTHGSGGSRTLIQTILTDFLNGFQAHPLHFLSHTTPLFLRL